MERKKERMKNIRHRHKGGKIGYKNEREKENKTSGVGREEGKIKRGKEQRMPKISYSTSPK